MLRHMSPYYSNTTGRERSPGLLLELLTFHHFYLMSPKLTNTSGKIQPLFTKWLQPAPGGRLVDLLVEQQTLKPPLYVVSETL